jgi:hypothetical protein
MANPTRPARIRGDGTLVDQVVKVRKSRKEGVTWFAQDGGGPYTITFDTPSPFNPSTYTVNTGGNTSTGPVIGDEGKQYRYEIAKADGSKRQGFVAVVTHLDEAVETAGFAIPGLAAR